MSCKIHIITCSMMSQRGGVKWQKIPWRDTPIIMNDGQAISWYAKVLLTYCYLCQVTAYLLCSYFPMLKFQLISMIGFRCCNC